MKKTDQFSTVGIIAEYNPFHNGHRHHIREARRLTGADYAAVVMSGDFVQRGTPAIYDKYTRAAMALHAGADLVIEMPAAFATGSAEDFAGCGVALLDRLLAVDTLCFGSECGDINSLMQIADILAHEPEDYTARLKEQMRQGKTFPEARLSALFPLLPTALCEILLEPNNILGIEYCKALIRRDSPIKPITIAREGSGYHDPLGISEGFSSATGLRKAMELHQSLEPLRNEVPDEVFHLIKDKRFLMPADFTSTLNTTLLRLTESSEPLSDYADVSGEMEGRIRNMVLDTCSFEERAFQLKTRQYTHTRASRALLHLMLGIKKADTTFWREHDYSPYARVLGFRKEAAPLLKKIKQAQGLPLITKTADAKQILSPEDYSLLKQDFYCSHLYRSVWTSRYGETLPNEFNHPLVIL